MNRRFSFEEEVLCGHTVTKEVKKLWAIELDLFDQLDRICKNTISNTAPAEERCWVPSGTAASFRGMMTWISS